MNALECVIPAHAQGLVPVYAGYSAKALTNSRTCGSRESVEVSSLRLPVVWVDAWGVQ